VILYDTPDVALIDIHNGYLPTQALKAQARDRLLTW
jgi:hypothetical protein